MVWSIVMGIFIGLIGTGHYMSKQMMKESDLYYWHKTTALAPQPTPNPSIPATSALTTIPTMAPTRSPTEILTSAPTSQPTEEPTAAPIIILLRHQH
eukprot:13169242-Ditylum_brightwellii.AAC.1